MKIQRVGSMTRVAVIFLLSSIVSAQSGGTFNIEKSVIAGGGGSAAGGVFTLDGTIGQSVAGTNSSGGVFTLDSGFWAGSAAPFSLSGTVTYGNAVSGPPPPRFVSNVTMTAAGSPNVVTTTGPAGPTVGQYSLSGFGSGSYTVTPTKTGGVGTSISSFDAGRIAQHVIGLVALTGNQLIVADVSGNNQIQSFDAAQISRYVLGLSGFGSTGTWRFIPVNRAYGSITSNISGEDYSALLMGEVSGNWSNAAPRPEGGGQSAVANGIGRPHLIEGSTLASPTLAEQVSSNPHAPVRSISVSIGTAVTRSRGEIVVPVEVDGAAGKGIIAYEFALRYDPSVIAPAGLPVDQAGTASRNLKAVFNAEQPGLLRVVAYGATSIDENGVLVNLKFKAVGAHGSASPLVWEKMLFNEGDPAAIVTNGQIEIFGASQILTE